MRRSRRGLLAAGVLMVVCLAVLALAIFVWVPGRLDDDSEQKGLEPNLIAVQATPKGYVVHFPRCYDEPVGTIGLTNSANRALWSASAKDRPRRLARFTIGVAPKGFADTIPLSAALPPDELQVTVLGPLGSGGVMTFRVDDVPSEGVLTSSGRRLTVDEFEDRTPCAS